MAFSSTHAVMGKALLARPATSRPAAQTHVVAAAQAPRNEEGRQGLQEAARRLVSVLTAVQIAAVPLAASAAIDYSNPASNPLLRNNPGGNISQGAKNINKNFTKAQSQLSTPDLGGAGQAVNKLSSGTPDLGALNPKKAADKIGGALSKASDKLGQNTPDIPNTPIGTYEFNPKNDAKKAADTIKSKTGPLGDIGSALSKASDKLGENTPDIPNTPIGTYEFNPKNDAKKAANKVQSGTPDLGALNPKKAADKIGNAFDKATNNVNPAKGLVDGRAG